MCRRMMLLAVVAVLLAEACAGRGGVDCIRVCNRVAAAEAAPGDDAVPAARAAETRKANTPAADDVHEAEFEAEFEAARVHRQKGRYDEALESFDEVERAGADAAAVALGRSRVYEAVGDWKRATDVLRAAVEKQPEDALLHARLAEVLFQQGRYDGAGLSAQAALKLDADQPLARLVHADLLTESGRLTEADDAYRWFVRFYNRRQPQDAETLLLVARGAVQYGRWHSSSQIFNFAVNTLCPDALQADEHHWQAYAVSGGLLLEKYNRAQALPEFQSALAINPRAAEVLAALGHAAFQQRDWDEADQFADRALKVNPRLVSALQLKADLALAQDDLDAARRFLDRALAVNPHDQRTLARSAVCLLIEDGLPPADRFERLLAQLDAIDDLALDRPSRFEQLVIELAQRNPRPGYFLSLLGENLESRRKFDAAEALYKRAMSLTPQLSEPKTALGMLYMRVGKTGEAREILDAAFKADPFHVRVSNMRKVLAVLEDYEVITTEHFVIRVDSRFDKLLGQYMAEYLESEYEGLVKEFGYEPPQRTHFEIYHNAKGLSAHQWFSARMVGLPWIQTIGASTGMIVALASPTASEQPFNWARVLKHEFVHVITLQMTDFNIPHWFTEALAVRSEGTPRPAVWNDLLRERVPKGRLRNLDTLNQGFARPESALDWQFAYCQSKLYLDYMVAEFGSECVPKLLDAYRRNLSTDAAIAEACGVEKQDFERGYRKYLNGIVAGMNAGNPAASGPRPTFAELEKAYRADPGDSQAAGEFAAALYQSGERRQARELALKALEQNEREPSAALVMAQLELRSEDLPAAADWLVPALDRRQPHSRVLDLLAKIRVQQKQYDEAAELCELGRKHFPDQSDWLKGLVVIHLRTNNTSKLKPALHALAELEYDDPVVRKKLAELAVEERDYQEALIQATAALHIDVLDADVHRLLGEAHHGLKQYGRAVREFSIALELNPGDADLETALVKAYIADGRREEAQQRLQQLLQRTPEHAEARRLLEGL